jgi:hypothetical protein
MEEQHKAIHRAQLQLTDEIASWRESASARARNAVADTIAQLLPALNEHLAAEEESAVPLIRKYITAAEWGAIAPEAAADIPPDRLPVIVGMMMYEAAPGVMDTVISQMPAEVQPSIRGGAARAYAAYAKELYGTTTPPRATP